MNRNPNSLAESRSRMLDKLSAKLDTQVGHRGDMHIADFIPLDQHNARLLIGYEPRQGEVDAADVKRFILAQFKNDVLPVMETLKHNHEEGAIALCVRAFIPTRPIDDTKAMVTIASNTLFLDQDLKETWQVQSGADGVKFLARVRSDSISDIIAERKRRMAVHASSVTFDKLAERTAAKIAARTDKQELLDVMLENEQLRAKINAGHLSANLPNLEVGDTVQFYDGGHLMQGKITAMSSAQGTVDVKSDAGMHSISREAVMALVERSNAAKEEERKQLAKYFEDAYGFKDYAKELTEEVSTK